MFDAMARFEGTSCVWVGALAGVDEAVELWTVGAGIDVDRVVLRPVKRRVPMFAGAGDGTWLIGSGQCRAW